MRILIAILACHARPANRTAQRATWLRDLPPGVDYRYFIGRATAAATAALEPDVVALDVDDSYRMLRSKTHGLIRWADARAYDWVWKCDDDTYARPAAMLASNFATADYSGFCDGRWGEVSGPDGGQIVYAYAQGGAGYWLSRRAVRIVADHMVDEYCEDLAVGKTLALHGIAPVHDIRYCPQIRPSELDDPRVRARFLTLHKVDAAAMRRLYAADLRLGVIPPQETVLCASA